MKKLILSLILLFTVTVSSQVEFGLYADKIMLLGDGENNKIGTLDLKATMDWHSKILTFKAQYEYAELSSGYYSRFTVGLGGYVDVVENVEAGLFGNIGLLKRKFVETPLTYSVLGELNYKLNDSWSISGHLEYVYRVDLEILWNEENAWKINGLIGIKYKIKDNWR